MTSGRDDARRRRGRGRADGPSDEEMGWLAELRQASQEGRTGRHTGEIPMHPDLVEERRSGRHTSEIRIEPSLIDPATAAKERRARENHIARHSGEIRIPPETFTEPPAGSVPDLPRRRRPESLADAVAQPEPAPEPTMTPTPPRAKRPSPPDNEPSTSRRRFRSGEATRAPAPQVPPDPQPSETEADLGALLSARRPKPAPQQRPSEAPRTEPPRTEPPRIESRSRSYTPYTPLQDYRGRELPSSIGASHGRVSGMHGIELDTTTLMAPLGARRKRQAKQVTMLRTATFVLLVLAIVGAPAAFFVIREFTRDPVFVELDNLGLPAWAAGKHTDAAVGSRWCIEECRSRQRTWQSARGPEETNRAYVAALKRAGWTGWNVPDCQAPGVDGVETCWQRDEYVLDLWVRAAVCETKAVRPTVAPTKPPSPSPPPAVSPANVCPGAIATIKVYNRISYQPSP